MRIGSGPARGFTLLEVMVAMAILAGALASIVGLTGSSMMKSERAGKLLVATMLAREKMADLELEIERGKLKGEFPEEKEEQGKFEEPFDGYSFEVKIKRVELPAPVVGEEGSVQDLVGKQLTKEIAQTVRELKLTVKWEERGGERQFDVVTHIVKL